MTPTARSGRPKRSSAEVLADAASELFLENGYAGTTVEQIAQRAGVSRGTFFNYFGGKSDLLWLDLDRSLAGLESALRASPALSAIEAVVEALLTVARDHDAERVPWALTQGDAMRLGDELTASAAGRFVRLQALVASFVGERRGERQDALLPQVVSATLLAAAGSAAVVWARSGIGRRPLVEVVEEALRPVARGLSGPASTQST